MEEALCKDPIQSLLSISTFRPFSSTFITCIQLQHLHFQGLCCAPKPNKTILLRFSLCASNSLHSTPVFELTASSLSLQAASEGERETQREQKEIPLIFLIVNVVLKKGKSCKRICPAIYMCSEGRRICVLFNIVKAFLIVQCLLITSIDTQEGRIIHTGCYFLINTR